MGDLEWTNDLVIRLMQEYAKRPELWDPSHEMYRVQTLKYETWRELSNLFDCDIADLRKKLNSLFASHRREKSKIRSGGRSTWFLYPYMSFLPTHLDSDSVDTTQRTAAPTKPRAPVKEVALPSTSEEDYEAEEDPIQEPVRVKAEPVPRPPRAYKRQALHHKPRLTRPIKRRIRSRDTYTAPAPAQADDRLSEALRLLKRADLSRKKDECDSFGEYISDSLRKHDERTQSMIKQAINNILFEQEMKKYNASNQYTVVISGIDENPLILGDHEESDK